MTGIYIQHNGQGAFREKGVVLRTNKRCSRSILTINGWLTINRYVLRPKTQADAGMHAVEHADCAMPFYSVDFCWKTSII